MQRKANSGGDDSKRRHIVTWSQEEDDILREQIRVYGTDNWTIIASKFKDKTTRQCRRRWYTYLNSDFKKGGWSPEEDLLLCEAQRIYGNRWTEIAKVVSGRTDNAVKNRFTTLCKKRAKYEALAKENSSSYINLNNKRVITHCPQYTTPANMKRIRRSHIPDVPESCNPVERLQGQPGGTDQQLRTPFSVLVQNLHRNLSTSHHQISDMQDTSDSDLSNKGTFLKKDDPKVGILLQQAELLSSLAVQVNLESTDQSFENAWKVLQDFLNQRKDSNISKHKTPDTDFQQDFRELLEDLVKSSNGGSQGSWRQPDLREDSPSSSEYSTGSTIMDHTVNDKNQQTIAPAAEDSRIPECEDEIFSTAVTGSVIFQPCDAQIDGKGGISAASFEEFGSPIQVTPLFRSLGAGIPSPKFSESERSFLMKTLGMDSSPCPAVGNNPSHPPPSCKRALLQSL